VENVTLISLCSKYSEDNIYQILSESTRVSQKIGGLLQKMLVWFSDSQCIIANFTTVCLFRPLQKLI